MHDGLWSRRTLLQSSLTAAAGIGLGLGAGLVTGLGPEADATTGEYVTRPELSPPRVTVTTHGAVPDSPPYFLLTAQGPAGQDGPLIIDRKGEVVWFRHAVDGGYATNLEVQSYRGKPVITWWESGKLVTSNLAIGAGAGYIADSSYNIIAVIRAQDHLRTDFHELTLTDQGTALITAYQRCTADLSRLGGSRHSYLWTGIVQEIDIATGRLVFSWDSLDHVPVTETLHHFYQGTTWRPFDYFHINSISVADDGNLLIGARNTCAVYKVNRRTGAIMWRLGGRSSDFAMGPGTRFWWQHHVREPRPGLLSVFDDGANPTKEPQSRGLLLTMDEDRRRCTLQRAYTSPARPLAVNQGSVQLLPDDSVLVGWGSEPAFSQFAADGSQVLYGQFPRSGWSYRAFTADWTGTPSDPPAVAVRGPVVYVSWNGATKVASWEVSAGASPDVLSPICSAAKAGFETAIHVDGPGPYFRVAAVDGAGNVLGQSVVVRSGQSDQAHRSHRPRQVRQSRRPDRSRR
jgi:Arylsulfotransferase (ASST)